MAELSVIVPVYNSEKLGLDLCIQSILSQNYKDFELILIDDGSTDSSLQICRHFASIDSRILVKSKKNAGPGAARNEGLNMASGKFITFVDSDDEIEAGYFSKLMERSTDTDLVLCGIIKDFSNGETKVYPARKGEGSVDDPDAFHSLIKSRLMFGPCNKIFRADIIRKNDICFPENIDYGEDRLFCYEYLKHIKTFVGVDTVFYRYKNQSNDSLSNKYRPDLFKLEYDQWRRLKDLYRHLGVFEESAQKDMYAELFWMANDAIAELNRTGRLDVAHVKAILSVSELDDICRYNGIIDTNFFIYKAIVKRKAYAVVLYYKLMGLCKK